MGVVRGMVYGVIVYLGGCGAFGKCFYEFTDALMNKTSAFMNYNMLSTDMSHIQPMRMPRFLRNARSRPGSLGLAADSNMKK